MADWRDLKSWYDDAVARGLESIKSVKTSPDRYHQKFYVIQAFLRFQDYWEARIRELKDQSRIGPHDR